MLLRLVVGAIATAAAVWLIPGIRVVAETDQQYILIMLGVAAIMGVVNAVIKPFHAGAVVLPGRGHLRPVPAGHQCQHAGIDRLDCPAVRHRLLR